MKDSANFNKKELNDLKEEGRKQVPENFTARNEARADSDER